MKNISIKIVKWLVGLLFVFSGFIKINDPLGLSYKMQEFFELWGMSFLDDYSLFLSIVMNTLEVLCGVSLIMGYYKKINQKILLLMITFFTFLTAYAMFSGKFKSCGCLGDCLPLTPDVSFGKDLVLLLLILLIQFFDKEETALAPAKSSHFIFLSFLVFSVAAQEYVIQYLPLLDCLPYKKGNNIPLLMLKPKDYVPDSNSIIYTYKKDGKLFEFDQNNLPEDIDLYEYVNRKDQLVKKGKGKPAIEDFTLKTLDGADSGNSILQWDKCVLVFSNHFPKEKSKWLEDFKNAKSLCAKRNIPIYWVTSQPENEIRELQSQGFNILTCDVTLIKTAARVNATYLLLKKGTIIDKISYKNNARVLKSIAEL